MAFKRLVCIVCIFLVKAKARKALDRCMTIDPKAKTRKAFNCMTNDPDSPPTHLQQPLAQVNDWRGLDRGTSGLEGYLGG